MASSFAQLQRSLFLKPSLPPTSSVAPPYHCHHRRRHDHHQQQKQTQKQQQRWKSSTDIRAKQDPAMKDSYQTSVRQHPATRSPSKASPRPPFMVGATVANLFSSPPSLAVVYQTIGTAYDVSSAAGLVAGSLMHMGGFRPYPSFAATVGTVTLATGFTCMMLAEAKLIWMIQQNPDPNEEQRANSSGILSGHSGNIPWTTHALQQRAEEIRNDFDIRLLDLSVWSGLGVSALTMAATKGGPTAMALSPGKLGVLQGLSLGSGIGGLAALSVIAAYKLKA